MDYELRTVLIPGTYEDSSEGAIEIEIRDVDGTISAHINNTKFMILDLSPLSGQIRLQKLVIRENTNLRSLDLSPLRSLKGLQHLDISMNWLRCLDLDPLRNLTSLQQLDIKGNSLKILDLSPLSNLTGLQQLDISMNWLRNIDLNLLSNLTGLQQLDISMNWLRKLDLSPTCGLTGLQQLDIHGNNSLSLESFLSRSTIESIVPCIFDSVYLDKVTFTFTPLNSFHVITQLLPMLEKHEESWKMHHLIQCTLALLDLEELGMLDIDSESFARILGQWEAPDFREGAREEFISYWIEQIESGGTTIGISLEHIQKSSELSLMADRIIELRAQEMVTFSKNDNVIDLRPLYLTAYGYQILQAFKKGLTCPVQEFDGVSESLEKLNFTIKVKEQPEHDKFSRPPHMSASLAEYIFQLVESRVSEEEDE